MKPAALLALAIGALALAGCGSGSAESSPLSYTAPTTLTITHPEDGALVRCTNHGVTPSAHVPAPGHGVSGAADGKSASAVLTLTRYEDGSLLVSCTP